MNIKVLFIEDDIKLLSNLVEYFNNEIIAEHKLQATSAGSFEIGAEIIKENEFDIVVLDLCQGEPSESSEKLGLKILKQIQSISFVPVIFYSGLAYSIGELKSEIVGVVNKGDGIEGLKKEIERIINSNLALIKGKIFNHVKESLRIYFWDIIHKNKEFIEPVKNDISLGYLLLRRIANSLSKENIKIILGDDKIQNTKAHPMEFYIYPPGDGDYEVGEILLKDDKYYTILTPSCDFISEHNRPRRVGKVLLAIAQPLIETDYGKAYKSSKTEANKQKITSLIEARKGDRYFFLPGTPFIENLVLDFQNKTMVDYDELKEFRRVTKLDDPFAQSMVASFIRYYNRIGFPDIDAEYILSKLT